MRREGLVVKRPGVLSKVQILNLVLGVGVFSLLSIIGDRKSLSIAKNHPKPSQEFSEQVRPPIHEMKGFSRNSP